MLIFLAGISFFAVCFVTFIFAFTIWEAKKVKLYQKRVSAVEREAMPTAAIVSRKNSAKFNEDLLDFYDKVPKSYRHSFSEGNHMRRKSFCEIRSSRLNQMVQRTSISHSYSFQATETELVMKLLFSPRNSIFQNGRRRDRRSLETSLRDSRLLRLGEELNHKQRRNTLCGTQIFTNRINLDLCFRSTIDKEATRILRIRQRRVAISFQPNFRLPEFQDAEEALDDEN